MCSPRYPAASLGCSSFSCDEDRLGQPEQPSETQRRASCFKYRGGHTVLRKTGRLPLAILRLTASLLTRNGNNVDAMKPECGCLTRRGLLDETEHN